MRSTTELIERKRDGESLEREEIRAFLAGAVDGSIPDYQVSAMLMAIYFQGMEDHELAEFTAAMLDSGDRLVIATDRPKVDKHSTGGVGDKVSIPLAPLVAACGIAVPMMSGRGLGHTGGTLDKLESIPGYRTALDPDEFARLVAAHGVVMAGQTDQIVPADRLLYAIRDTSGSVPSIPLIASSIMSKKLAEDLDALVLDIKVGAGAFMRSPDAARVLGETMAAIGKAHGVTVRALLTAMDQPLGTHVGNALEIRESIAVLRGEGPPDTTELVVVLGEAMLEAGGVEGGRERLEQALASGAGLERFRQMVGAQGGDLRVVDDPELLPQANERHTLTAPRAGYVTALDALEVGRAALELGAGRRTTDDVIDPAVGIVLLAKVGDEVSSGDPLAELHANSPADAAATRLLDAYELADAKPEERPLVLDEVR